MSTRTRKRLVTTDPARVFLKTLEVPGVGFRAFACKGGRPGGRPAVEDRIPCGMAEGRTRKAAVRGALADLRAAARLARRR